MTSLRGRLLWTTGLGVLVVLLAAGGLLYALMRSSLLSEFDRALLRQANALTGLIEQEGQGLDLEFEESLEFRRPERPEYYQIWREAGEVLQRSPSLGQDTLLALTPNQIEPLTLPDGLAGRVVTVRFSPPLDEERLAGAPLGPLFFSLARDTADTQRTLSTLLFSLSLLGLITMTLVMGVLAWLVPLGLRPASRLAQDISELNEQRLSSRLKVEGAPLELAPIALRLNELLERLARAFQREKDMTADISHELRTPLAGLRAMLEVSLSKERRPSDYQETLSDCLLICQQSQGLVEALLTLYRVESSNEDLIRQEVEAATLLRGSWQPLQRKAQEKGLVVSWRLQEPLIIKSNPEQLRLVFGNILENAAHYTAPNGEINIEARAADKGLYLCVTNTGCKLTSKDAEHIFERFWRGEAARESDGHYGLGLALCKAILARLGGSTSVEITPGIFSVTIML